MPFASRKSKALTLSADETTATWVTSLSPVRTDGPTSSKLRERVGWTRVDLLSKRSNFSRDMTWSSVQLIRSENSQLEPRLFDSSLSASLTLSALLWRIIYSLGCLKGSPSPIFHDQMVTTINAFLVPVAELTWPKIIYSGTLHPSKIHSHTFVLLMKTGHRLV